MSVQIQKKSLQDALQDALQDILANLGNGRTDSTAYDTAWVARLSGIYDNEIFADATEWLRKNQHPDGSWGTKRLHYHDRFISTLAAVVALTHVGSGSRDERRIEAGIRALWHIVGGLNRDSHDTVGFPILSAALIKEAQSLGLDVPQAPIRYAAAYQHKVDELLAQEDRQWRKNSLTFSLEALRAALTERDDVIENNFSVGGSLAATASYLECFDNPAVMDYLVRTIEDEGTGAAPLFIPIDLFEIAWSLHHLRHAGVITPNHPDIKRALDILWAQWSPKYGIGYSSVMNLYDSDDAAAAYSVLKWGGYPVEPDMLNTYEQSDYFACYPNETDPSMSVQIRLLSVIRDLDDDTPDKNRWIQKILKALRKNDENGAFWMDKWHTSPYYVNSAAVSTLYGLDDHLATSRFKWILNTQNRDGGWGFMADSTAEETAYSLNALLWWDKYVVRVENGILNRGFNYLQTCWLQERYEPLWIAKSVYTPHYPVKSAIIRAMYTYLQR